MRQRCGAGIAAIFALVVGWQADVVLAQDGAARAAHGQPGSLAARIDAHVDAPRFAAASWGIEVVSIDSGRTLYSRHPQRLLVPASVAKLFTAVTVLDRFGPDHRIATTVYATAPLVRDGVLRGDLVLYGNGDPSLGIDTRKDWAKNLALALRRAGLREVRGDLFADATRFAAPRYGSGWEAADLQSWFGTSTSALTVDDNVVAVTVAPASAAGQLATIRFEPEASAPRLDNTLRTVPARTAFDISLIRRPGEPTLFAFGSIAANAGERRYRIALDDPARIAGEQLRKAMSAAGIGIRGDVRSLYWPERRRAETDMPLVKLAEDWSPPLSDLVRRGMKVSHNLYLQNLLLVVGADEGDRVIAAQPDAARPPAFRSSEKLGLDAMQRYLRTLGIGRNEVDLEDGAGLSRRNLVTANAIVRLLVGLADDPRHLAFRQSLPEAGIDGTLAGRMRNSAAASHVFAKTGSLSMTWSLAGYATTRAGERLAFAFLLNNYQPPDGASVRPGAELDALALMLAELSVRTGTPVPEAASVEVR